MIRIVENLEKLKLIDRQPHQVHGKILTTSLTASGARRVADCHAAVQAVEERMLKWLGASERANLRRLLGMCADALDGSSA
jgi:DNA-binding MarR family transcriptional regulator